jgi:hypothetical protein
VHSKSDSKSVLLAQNQTGADIVSQDGFLMPVKKGQPPPDLRYFKPAGK